MNIEEVRAYCLTKKGSEESFPFDEDTLVFKVMGKMFALTSLAKSTGVNLKCDPAKSISLREENEGIIPGFHMNKKHWNTVDYMAVSNDIIKELIDHSCHLVTSSLTRKHKEELAKL